MQGGISSCPQLASVKLVGEAHGGPCWEQAGGIAVHTQPGCLLRIPHESSGWAACTGASVLLSTSCRMRYRSLQLCDLLLLNCKSIFLSSAA